MDLGLKGKVAMVAGASRGLGFGVARALAEEGVKISMSSRDLAAIRAAGKKIETKAGSEVLAVESDVRSAEAILYWRDATLERFGSVDLLFTNSGGPPAGTFSQLDDSPWREGFELLVLSAIRMVRAVLPSMQSRRSGSIVLSTSASVKEPIPNLTLSNVLRASVAALAKTLAAEFAGEGIRVNHAIPGRIDTDRVRELDGINAKRAGITVSAQRERVLKSIPLGRYGEVEDYGRAVAFLLSDAAAYITGATLQIDGGVIRSVL